MRFWDSSAIVPLLIHQGESKRSEAWLKEDQGVAMWTFTSTEVTSALWRIAREGNMSDDDARNAEARLDALVQASHFVAVTEPTKQAARRLLRVHALTAADALQLGAALVWSGGQPDGKTVLTFDQRLATAARREGFEVP